MTTFEPGAKRAEFQIARMASFLGCETKRAFVTSGTERKTRRRPVTPIGNAGRIRVVVDVG